MTLEIRSIQRACRIFVAAAVLIVGSVCVTAHAAGQHKITKPKNQIVGTWKLVSGEAMKDGKKIELFGDRPVGLYIFDTNGRFSAEVLRNDLPKFKIADRYQGTAAENKAVVVGSIFYFGTYTVTDSGDLTLHIVASSFPNWDGTDQRRSIVITGDVMDYSNKLTSFGASAHQVWKRVAPGEKLTK